ncbi:MULTISPECIES: hypothetical protein [Prochlorococcus]|nr:MULTISPECIES: hypothetical protein [Prochlorococcus]KGG14436.1 hypothetical protein EV04_0013 [Prochlorococcus marinus str. LG]KGG34190.1 hypothetical protein EV10_0036 [Prochlorococcus marinus str. SS51]
MKITFTFGSEEIDCKEFADAIGVESNVDEADNVTISYELNKEDLKNIEGLKKLRMEELCRQFFDDILAEETISVRWHNN